ncbi:hypothetical protein N656DRAFT_780195 [Canariomyces notabilis]|uniref:Uncharacterized protein n=1 Tax=Canariomyces notabilis TaxID=2074819 RepID=A0AAN6TCU4_9PEZI|nr:hypothetical protein N656DRAFT_780195 [Canariomyces arenarius]
MRPIRVNLPALPSIPTPTLLRTTTYSMFALSWPWFTLRWLATFITMLRPVAGLPTSSSFRRWWRLPVEVSHVSPVFSKVLAPPQRDGPRISSVLYRARFSSSSPPVRTNRHQVAKGWWWMDGWTDYQTSVVLLNDTLGGRGSSSPTSVQPAAFKTFPSRIDRAPRS